jgi:hypothetical protein
MVEAAISRSKMSKSLRVQATLLVFFAGVFPVMTLLGQAVKGDFSSMAAAGKVNDDIYQNSILGITLSAPKARWEVRGPISAAAKQGRLIDAVYDVGVAAAWTSRKLHSWLACRVSREFPQRDNTGPICSWSPTTRGR